MQSQVRYYLAGVSKYLSLGALKHWEMLCFHSKKKRPTSQNHPPLMSLTRGRLFLGGGTSGARSSVWAPSPDSLGGRQICPSVHTLCEAFAQPREPSAQQPPSKFHLNSQNTAQNQTWVTQIHVQTLGGGVNWVIFQALTPAHTADRFSHLAEQMIGFATGKSILEIFFACINCMMLQPL